MTVTPEQRAAGLESERQACRLWMNQNKADLGVAFDWMVERLADTNAMTLLGVGVAIVDQGAQSYGVAYWNGMVREQRFRTANNLVSPTARAESQGAFW